MTAAMPVADRHCLLAFVPLACYSLGHATGAIEVLLIEDDAAFARTVSGMLEQIRDQDTAAISAFPLLGVRSIKRAAS